MVLTDYVDFLPPMHVTACCGAIVLVLFGVLSQKEAFASFEMLTVFMLAFMMPLGTALNDTGAGKMIADAVISVTGQSSPMIIMASLWILTWALTQVMSNTAACTLLCPIFIHFINSSIFINMNRGVVRNDAYGSPVF